ncbi:hypothetical protein F506_10650 [Herbaspirillum hiltneri N3]|uniref:Uncharacterized protein n=1 Tax=Herbaspirillum hiltneri N3 TaxID=1262470 RepID=A0ABM5V0F4_9BURK|nr:hypothetical protein F506_10650 [Herbaspirillum hiltneri N3]
MRESCLQATQQPGKKMGSASFPCEQIPPTWISIWDMEHRRITTSSTPRQKQQRAVGGKQDGSAACTIQHHQEDI